MHAVLLRDVQSAAASNGLYYVRVPVPEAPGQYLYATALAVRRAWELLAAVMRLSCAVGGVLQCAVLESKLRHNVTFHADATGTVTSLELKFPRTFTGCTRKGPSKRTLPSSFKSEALLKVITELDECVFPLWQLGLHNAWIVASDCESAASLQQRRAACRTPASEPARRTRRARTGSPQKHRSSRPSFGNTCVAPSHAKCG